MEVKDFIKSFQGSESNLEWIDGATKKADVAERLANYREDIVRLQKRIAVIEDEVGLSTLEIKEINRRMSMGEARARRAKKEMVEMNLHKQLRQMANTFLNHRKIGESEARSPYQQEYP